MSAPPASSPAAPSDRPAKEFPLSLSGPGRRRAELAFAGLCWMVALATFLLPVSNPDIFWHLSAARRIVSTGAIPRADWLSWTMAGRPWTDFEWLAQIIWYALRQTVGLWGWVGLKALLFLGGAICLWRTLRLYALGVPGRALALLAWAIALLPGNDLRPENFSLFFFSLEWLFLETRRLDWASGRAQEEGKRMPVVRPLALALLFALWANLHPGFLYGLVLMGIFALGEAIRRKSWTLARWTFACALGTLLNPFGVGLYRVVLEHVRYIGDLQQYIQEWQEPSVLSPYLATFWVILLLAFAAVLIRFIRERDVPAEHLASLGLFSLSAASHNRTTMYFTLLGVPIAAFHLRLLLGDSSRRLRTVGMASAAALLFAFFAVYNLPELRLRRPFVPRFTQESLVEFLQSERETLAGRKLLNPWEWGGCLGYELSPDYKVFVDGRYIFHSFLKPLLEAAASPEAYRKFLDRFGIEVVIHRRNHQFLSMSADVPGERKIPILRPFYLLFLPRSAWALVYWDYTSMVFVRRAAFPAEWIRAREFKILRPDDLRAAQLLVTKGLVPEGELWSEVDRFLRLHPGLPEDAPLRAWAAQIHRENPR